METNTENQGHPKKTDNDPLPHIANALRGLRFGTVTIVVQDGVVVQVDRTEKHRFRTSKRHL